MKPRATKPALLHLDEEDLRRLRRVAFKRFEAAGGRMSVSALVREAIRDYLRKEASNMDTARRKEFPK